jgi:hypothetical protein
MALKRSAAVAPKDVCFVPASSLPVLYRYGATQNMPISRHFSVWSQPDRTGDLLLAKAVWGSMGGVGRARMPINRGLRVRWGSLVAAVFRVCLIFA